MKKFYVSLFSLTMILATMAAHAFEAKVVTQQGQPAQLSETYTNSDSKYSISYPSNWQKKEMPSLDLVLLIPSKEDSSRVQASMNIISEKPEAPITLDQFFSESLENLTAELKNVDIKQKGDRDLNGTPSKWILYTHEMQGIKFTVLQYFLVANEKVYLLTLSSTEDHYDDYKADFDAVVNSFKITK